jgi:hypothetical protein
MDKDDQDSFMGIQQSLPRQYMMEDKTERSTQHLQI